MYEFHDRVRYSETDINGECTLVAAVNYLQDCATFHSHDVGLTIEKLTALNDAWLLSSWDIYVNRFPTLCENVIIGTSPHPAKGILVDRDLWIKSEDTGEYLLRAHSLWFCFDIEKQKPKRISPEIIEPFGELKDYLQLPETERKIALPDEADMKQAEPITVSPHHIDSNNHVNNAQYVEMADETLAKLTQGKRRFHSGRIRAEYKKPAVLGDTVIPYYGRTDNGLAVSLRDPSGVIYANVEFSEVGLPSGM